MFKKAKEHLLYTAKLQTLEHFHMLKLFPDEKVLVIQRQHWIVLVMPFLIIAFVFGLFVFLFNLLISALHLLPDVEVHTFSLYGVLLLSSFLFMMATYVFMRWYYQFYIVTNKRVLHVHFFRIGGFFIEEIFLEKLLECEIERKAPNFIYDLFDIEDVIVHFGNIEFKEPFVFEVPSDAGKIEEFLDAHSIKQHNRFL